MAQGTFYSVCWKREGWTQGNVAEGRTRTQGLFVCLEVNVFFFWNQVVQDVGSQCSNTEGLDGSTSPIIQRKLELDKVCVWECSLSRWRLQLPPATSEFHCTVCIPLWIYTLVFLHFNVGCWHHLFQPTHDTTVPLAFSEVTLLWLLSWPAFKEL